MALPVDAPSQAARRLRWLAHPLMAALITARVAVDPAHRVLGRAEGEFRDHLWVSWLVARRVFDDHALPITFPLANFPDTLSLYPLDPLNQGVLLLLSPLGLLPAHFLLAFGLLWVAGFGASRLAAAAGASPWASTGAGLLYVVGPPVLGVYVDTQTEGMGSGWVLLTLASLISTEAWTTRRALNLGLLGGASILSAPYQAHALLLVGVPLGLWAFRRHVVLGLLALACAAPAGGLAALGLTAAETHTDGQLTHRERGSGWPPRTYLRVGEVPPQIQQVSALSPVEVGAWPREARFLPPTTGPRRASGWVLPILTLLAWRERRARLLVAIAAVYTSLTLGSALDYPWTSVGQLRIPLPFDLWYRWFPGGHFAWKPQQYGVLAWAAAAAAVAVAPRSIVAALVVVELQVWGPTPLPLPAMELHPLEVDQTLATLPAGGVLEFPSRARGRLGPETLPADDLLHQITHGHPIGEPFGRGFNRPRQGVADSLAGGLGWVGNVGAVDTTLEFAYRQGFRYLVVHTAALDPPERHLLTTLLPAYHQSFADGVWLYTLDGHPTGP